MLAIRYLSLYQDKEALRRMNYGALDVEELGSVYESLLDFSPEIRLHGDSYQFYLIPGSDRKTTGSYYTPPSLVQQLINTTLEPIILEKLNEVDKIKALLSLKIIDPSCGSGHFLLAAARRLGKEIAELRSGHQQPEAEILRQSIRDVIQNCIYGVDLNPLAVDLCKVALWLEGFCAGKPLTFLDHRIKCGNSLVGVLNLDCLQDGIPDEAFNPVAGDDKKLATQLKKNNKQQRGDTLQIELSLFDDISNHRIAYVNIWQELGEIHENTTLEVKQKHQKYYESRQNPLWWQDYSACNLWVAAFFMPLTTENLQLLPTTQGLKQVLNGNLSHQRMIEAANKLSEKYRFFHWCLEFPDVFDEGGFDAVLGNPPWERIKLQQKEFFATRSIEISEAQNKAVREKLIQGLSAKDSALATAFAQAKHGADAQSKFIRESGRFELTGVGDINTYSVFAETARNLLNSKGRAGIIVPTGIATDDTCKKFFGDLIKKRNLASLYDFENKESLFPGVHSRMKFSLLAMTGYSIQRGSFAFFLTQTEQLADTRRLLTLTDDDIKLINPNTLTCPIFRTSKDAELTKKIYKRVPVLENQNTSANPWGISFMCMFDMASDSGLFFSNSSDATEDKNLLPLYEAKMFHQFEHRWATYREDGKTENVTDKAKSDTSFTVQPRYWVSSTEVENKLAGKWDRSWFLAFRDICNATNERTVICSILPKVAIGNNAPVILFDINKVKLIACLTANLNSLVFDYVARQKVGGTHLNFFIIKQLPVLPPEAYTEKDIEYITPRVLELVYTAEDMRAFAVDIGYGGEPFVWNANRRRLIRAELDAYYAHLYGLTEEELRYILDPSEVCGEDFPSESFRVLKSKEVKEYGEYLTSKLTYSKAGRELAKEL